MYLLKAYKLIWLCNFTVCVIVYKTAMGTNNDTFLSPKQKEILQSKNWEVHQTKNIFNLLSLQPLLPSVDMVLLFTSLVYGMWKSFFLNIFTKALLDLWTYVDSCICKKWKFSMYTAHISGFFPLVIMFLLLWKGVSSNISICFFHAGGSFSS